MSARYATLSDVQGRVPSRTLSATTKPDTSRVQAWLDEAERMLNQALLAAELPAPYTTAGATAILGVWVTDYAEGRVRIAFANAGGDGGNDDGERLIESFNDRLSDILTRPTFYGAWLAGGSSPAAANRVRAYVTDNTDGKSIAAGDFAPTFTTNTNRIT